MLKRTLRLRSHVSLRSAARVGLLFGLLHVLSVLTVAQGTVSTLPPEAERQLAREIYKEMVEIKSGSNTGATR